MSDWFSSSYMARRGVAGGRVGKTHQLTEAKQGSYQYVYGPYAAPVLTIAPGDVVVAETLDAFGGAIKSVDDKPSEKLKFPFVNPQNGPIAVEGAEKGDVLCVRIERIVPRGPQPVGTSALIPEFGGLVGNAGTPMLNPPLPERVMKYHVTESGVRFNDKITLPFEPFIGTLGVSPQIEAVLSLQPDYWGGNMDLPDVAPGAIAYFPVQTKGRQSLSRRLPRPAGRRRTLRRRRRDPLDDHGPGRSHQVLADRLAAARERALHHDDRLRPSDGGRGAHRLSRTHPLARSRLRFRRARGLFSADAGGQDARRQHGRSEVHVGRLDTQRLSAVERNSRRGAWISD